MFACAFSHFAGSCEQDVVEAVYVAGENTVKGYTKLINKTGAYTEIANNGTDQNRVKE